MSVAWVGVLAGLALLSAWAWGRRRPVQGETWVLTREGPVRFGVGHAVLVPWSALRSVDAGDDLVRITLDPASVQATAYGGQLEPLSAELAIPAQALGDRSVASFASVCASAWRDERARAGLPTFRHPDGPPEALGLDAADR